MADKTLAKFKEKLNVLAEEKREAQKNKKSMTTLSKNNKEWEARIKQMMNEFIVKEKEEANSCWLM